MVSVTDPYVRILGFLDRVVLENKISLHISQSSEILLCMFPCPVPLNDKFLCACQKKGGIFDIFFDEKVTGITLPGHQAMKEWQLKYDRALSWVITGLEFGASLTRTRTVIIEPLPQWLRGGWRERKGQQEKGRGQFLFRPYTDDQFSATAN
jgi:hypothetical protein